MCDLTSRWLQMCSVNILVRVSCGTSRFSVDSNSLNSFTLSKLSAVVFLGRQHASPGLVYISKPVEAIMWWHLYIETQSTPQDRAGGWVKEIRRAAVGSHFSSLVESNFQQQLLRLLLKLQGFPHDVCLMLNLTRPPMQHQTGGWKSWNDVSSLHKHGDIHTTVLQKPSDGRTVRQSHRLKHQFGVACEWPSREALAPSS